MPVATATITRIHKLFKRPGSPRKKDSGGGSWEGTKYGGRLSPASSCGSLGSLDASFRRKRKVAAPKPPDRVTFATTRTAHPSPPLPEDPAELWWTADERREQLARTEWLVALETKRKLRDEPTPPVPGESRRGLGVACEPSTPAARAAKIAANRRAIVAASQHSEPEALATFAAALSLDAVAAAKSIAADDARAAQCDGAARAGRVPPLPFPPFLSDEPPPPPAPFRRAPDSLEAAPALSQILRRDSLQAFDAPLRGALGAGARPPLEPAALAPTAVANSFLMNDPEAYSVLRRSRSRSRDANPFDGEASSMDSTCYGSPASASYYGSPLDMDA